METIDDQKSKVAAFTFTAIFHALLLVAFIMIVFVKSPPAEAKVALRADGYVLLGEVAPEASSSEVKNNGPSKGADLISDPEANMIRTNKLLGQKSNPEQNELTNALMKLRSHKNTTSSITGTQIAEQGPQHPGENSVVGTPNVQLAGRVLLMKPSTILNSAEEGKVVVEIIVNENGKVISATPGQRGSTTTSMMLYERAKQAALSAKFSASEQHNQEQRGTYTFVFTLE